MKDTNVTVLFDERQSYRTLVDRLHGGDLQCPKGHQLPPEQAPHDRSRAPVVSYRCRECGAVFNLFSRTAWCGTHYDCTTVLLILRGIEERVPTTELADLLCIDYSTLLQRRRHLERCLENGISTGLREEASIRMREEV